MAAYAAREAENESPEEKKKGEEAAAKRLADRVRGARKGKGSAETPTTATTTTSSGKISMGDGDVWGEAPEDKETSEHVNGDGEANKEVVENGTTNTTAVEEKGEEEKGEEEKKKSGEVAVENVTTSAIDEKDVPPTPKSVKKFRGIPEDVKLFEVFWHQVVELIKVREKGF